MFDYHMTPGEKGGGSPFLHPDSFFFFVGRVLIFFFFFFFFFYLPGSSLARFFIGRVLLFTRFFIGQVHYWPGSFI